MEYTSLRDLKHDPELATALGNMVVAWAHAESTLLLTLARVTGASAHMAQAGYYRIPTFESRTKFILGLMAEWHPPPADFSREKIIKAVEKLSKLASARNGWVHGDWCVAADKSHTVIFDHRADSESPHRRRPVKAADVRNHNEAVLKRAEELDDLILSDELLASPEKPQRPFDGQ